MVSTTEDKWNTTWNIGNKNSTITIYELASYLKNCYQSESPITFVDPKSIHGELFEDAPMKMPDSSLLGSIGWKATKGLEDMVKEMK